MCWHVLCIPKHRRNSVASNSCFWLVRVLAKAIAYLPVPPSAASASMDATSSFVMAPTGSLRAGSQGTLFSAESPSVRTCVRTGQTVQSGTGITRTTRAAVLVVGAFAMSKRSHRRQHHTMTKLAEQSFDSESVLELAKRANVKLEVKPWEFLSGIAKDAARGWFVKRAEERGIKWSELVQESQASQVELDQHYDDLCDAELEYPDYYHHPFHGYDDGNLNWKAAHELLPATQSMCLSYYDGLSWQDAQEKFRGTMRRTMTEAWNRHHGDAQPQTLLDMGCSCGFSTAEMVRAFPGVSATGLDLSPHFLAAATQQHPDLKFVHGLAEETKLEANSVDVVTLNFLLHEVPLDTSGEIIAESLRLLRPGGMLAILDVDPRRLLELPPMRRWAFQVTEPWCKDGEYYSLK
eukprot:3946305-Amphidinium_carterae.1